VKYELETLPVQDAWASDAPCPLCRLMKAAEDRHVNYYLGNSVMNPETRLQVNETGFCPRHFPMLREAGRAHHLGLVAHTHLQSVRGRLDAAIRRLVQGGSAKDAAAFSASIRGITEGCLVCRSMERDLERYAYTAVVLHRDDEEFRRHFWASRGPCLPHAADLAEMAAAVLGRSARRRFLTVLGEHVGHILARLEDDVLHFTRKFDPQYDDEDWGEARDAHARTVQMLAGRDVRLGD